MLSLLLSNLAMATVPGSVPLDKEPHVHLAICADNTVLWCTGQPSRTTTVRASVPDALHSVSARLNRLDLTAFLKNCVRCIPPRKRLPPTEEVIYLNGEPVRRARTRRCLGAVFDDRVTFCPAVADVLARDHTVYSS